MHSRSRDDKMHTARRLVDIHHTQHCTQRTAHCTRTIITLVNQLTHKRRSHRLTHTRNPPFFVLPAVRPQLTARRSQRRPIESANQYLLGESNGRSPAGDFSHSGFAQSKSGRSFFNLVWLRCSVSLKS